MRKRKEAFVEEKKEMKEQMERRHIDKQGGRKLARLAIISTVIYETLLSITYARGNTFTTKR